MPGPIAAFRSRGRLPKRRRISPTPFSTIRFTVPTPARVKHAHGAAFRVDENDGQTIGGLNAEQQTRSCGDQAIANNGCGRIKAVEKRDR